MVVQAGCLLYLIYRSLGLLALFVPGEAAALVVILLVRANAGTFRRLQIVSVAGERLLLHGSLRAEYVLVLIHLPFLEWRVYTGFVLICPCAVIISRSTSTI